MLWHAVRMAKLVCGLVWAGALVLLGLWLRGQADPPLWLVPLAAGEFVLMWFVIDELSGKASAGLTGFFKLTMAMVFWGALGVSLIRWWPMVEMVL